MEGHFSKFRPQNTNVVKNKLTGAAEVVSVAPGSVVVVAMGVDIVVGAGVVTVVEVVVVDVVVVVVVPTNSVCFS